MNKLTILTVILLFTASAASAQQRTGAISGQVTDNATSEKIAGAVIEMKSKTDSTFVKRELSDKESKFSVANLPYGDYTMRITFLGYEPLARSITVNSRNMNISHVMLNQSTTQLDEVNVMAQAMRTSMNGDTLIYNAHAFKVSQDADADELLRQLPGVEVGQDGKVKAQGKDVQKIFVDGKETFGTDVATTMKNIPANVIDKVEVYNKLSDFAETTGINDGDDYQVMNFVTGVTFAQFGTFTALYGIEDKYGLEARYNIVTGNHGIMLNATANNTGAMGFGGGFGGGGFGGMVMAGMMGGGGYGSRFGGGRGMSANSKSSAYNTGVNYNYQNSEKLKLSFNYRYGHSDNETKSASDRTYFNEEVLKNYNRSTDDNDNNSINNSHNFGGNVQWKIKPKQRLNLRFEGSYSNGNSGSSGKSYLFTDEVENLFRYDGSRVRGHSESYNFSGGLNYGLGFDKQGRSLSIGLNAGTNKNDGNTLTDTHTIIPEYTPAALDSLGRSYTVNDSKGWNVRARVQYTEPLSRYWSMTAVYDFSYRFSDRNNTSRKWDYTDDFNDGTFVPWGQNSNISETRDLSHRIGPGIYYSKNNNVLRFDFVYKYTNQELERTLPEPYFKGDVGFNNFVYNAMYNMQLSPQKRLEFRIEADTQNPSITQLQDVDNRSTNGLYVTAGNPDLKPYYTHSGSIGYNTNSITKATNFSVTANASITTDYVGTIKKIVTEDKWTTPNGTDIIKGGQYSRYINMNKSSWNLGLSSSFSKPLNFMKSNFNVGANASYSESPGYINDQENTARTQSYSARANLSSNWNTKLTMYLNYSFSPSFTNNTNKTYRKSSTIGNSLSYNASWETWLSFVLRANLTYTNNLTKQKNTPDYRYENTACNLSLGKKIFRNKRGELTFAVNDLFNQNSYSTQSVNPDYIENIVDKGIGRYFSISFTYRLRDFHKNGQSMSRGMGRPDRGDDFMRGSGGGMRMRGGMGGMRGM